MAGLETKLQFTERQLSLVQDQYKQQGEEIGEFGLLRRFDRSGRMEYLIGCREQEQIIERLSKSIHSSERAHRKRSDGHRTRRSTVQEES